MTEGETGVGAEAMFSPNYFSPYSGTKLLHDVRIGSVYGENMAEDKNGICLNCGKSFIKQREGSKCCSRICRNEWFGQKNTRYCVTCSKPFMRKNHGKTEQKNCSWKCGIEYKKKRIDNTCKYCDKVFQTVLSERREFCSQLCGALANSPWVEEEEYLMLGIYPFLKLKEMSFILKKKEKAIDFKLRKKYRPLRKGYPTGEEHYRWTGGREPYYGPNWVQQQALCRERDNYACRKCGVTEDEIDYHLHVHHIVALTEFKRDFEKANKLNNLISLCRKCHTEVEHARDKNMQLLWQTEEAPRKLSECHATSV